jgi:tRNA1(Val) A37 N6-methylase TrmN6
MQECVSLLRSLNCVVMINLSINSLELGAGGGLVALGVAIGCEVHTPIYITDQENMLALIGQNIELNGVAERAIPLVLNW